MNNTTFAAVCVGAAVVGGVIGHKIVKSLPDRFTVFGKTFVRKAK